MDCWGEAGDFVVPNHLELSDIFPSDYCLGWAASERFGPPNKYGASATNLTREELNFGGSRSHDEVKNETFIHEEESSTDTSRCGGFPLVDYSGGNSEASRDGTGLLDDWQDYQIDGIDNMDQMDDSFLGSLLEDTSPDMENPYRPVSMFPELECNTMSFHNLLNDMLLDSWCISRDLSGIHSLKNLNTHSFSSREESTPLFMLSNSGQIKGSSMTKVPATVLIPAELENLCATDGHLSVGKSLEESVLQELEVVMTQVNLTKNTRICFRDALYRLAKSLEQQHMGSQSQSGEITMDKCSLSTVHNETSRFRRANPAQFETNTIDRTIETLMFKKLNCDAPNLSSVAPVNFGEESVKTTGTPNYSLKQTPILPYTHISVLPHDAEVPIFGRNNQTAIDSYKNFKNRPSTRI